jgi:hypothetical protein
MKLGLSYYRTQFEGFSRQIIQDDKYLAVNRLMKLSSENGRKRRMCEIM